MTRRSSSGGLRQGFTTGSAAAAAAKAALTFLLTGEVQSAVDIPLPPGGRLTVPVESVGMEGAAARATVVKDAGDDPDATHGARISCLASIAPSEAVNLSDAGGEGQRERSPQPEHSAPPGHVDIEGGSGVGRVTLPGLPVPVGQAAINPVPRAQIEQAAREALQASGLTSQARQVRQVRLVIEVEGGEAMASRTLNPRLGILGGISILGTQGIVMPFSLEAWKATIDSGLEVARAAAFSTGRRTAAFSTGRRGERLLMARRLDLPELAFIQAADFFAYAIERAVRLDYSEIVWGCFFGKLAKMAQGLPYTHAHAAPTDFAALAELAGRAGASPETCLEVARANTARHALLIVPDDAIRERFAALTCAMALEAARSFALTALGERPGSSAEPNAGPEPRPIPRLGICCFDFEGGLLAEAYTS